MANYQPATPSPLRQLLDDSAADLATIAHLPVAPRLQREQDKLVEKLPDYERKKGKFNPVVSVLMLGARKDFKGKVKRHNEWVHSLSETYGQAVQRPSQAGTFATTSSLTDPRSHITTLAEQLKGLGFQPLGPEKMELVRGRLMPVVHSLDGRRAIRQEDGTYQVDPGSGSE